MIDATVVGAGPNGLSAALTLAYAGLHVRVVERNATIGGGVRSQELTLPGFVHDVCSAVYPAALASPFFRAWGLTERVPFAIPDVSYAHPLDGGRAAIAYRDLVITAERLGRDGRVWRQMLGPLVDRIDEVTDVTGATLLRLPPHPVMAARFGTRALTRGGPWWRVGFRGEAAPALLAGAMAHANGQLPALGPAGAGLLLAAHGHAAGWGLPVGGAQRIVDALADDLRAHGGEIITDVEVRDRSDLEPSTVTLLDTSVEFLAGFGGDDLPIRYRRALAGVRRGPGVAKVDMALSAPVPWANAEVGFAPTVHLGGTGAAIAASEAAVAHGRVSDDPYVLLVQPTVADPTRAPTGQHVLWAYLHVPNGSSFDPTEAILRQVERFAPGFRDTVLAVATRTADALEHENPNYLGGDITGGATTLWQLVKRPKLTAQPWRTPVSGLYLCSAATTPGPAVHGMSGWYAARLALRDHFGIRAELVDFAN